MKTYEYIRIILDFGDLAQLNRLSSIGWKVVAVVNEYALLEREIHPGG